MSDNLNISGDASAPVPVFNCHVFISSADGKCHARFANIDLAPIEAANERSALSKAVTEFKNHIVELKQTSKPIEWRDPLLDMKDDEVERLIPVHL